jgi:hypothetical protein
MVGSRLSRAILRLEIGYRDFVAQISEDGLERYAIALPNSDSLKSKSTYDLR